MPRKISSNSFRNLSWKAKGRATPVVDLSDADCLCLVCRQTGHVVEWCPWFLQWKNRGGEQDTSFNASRPSPPLDFYSPQIKGSADAICQRCKQLHVALDILEGTVLCDTSDPETAQIPPLGPVTSLRLLSTCPVCRLIFNISYLTDVDLRTVAFPEDAIGHQLVLLPAWTVHRLQGYLAWPGYQKGEGPYAKCLYTALLYGGSLNHDEKLAIVDKALDAVGIADAGGNAGKGARALGVKKVDRQVPDYTMIKDWFRLCNDLHDTTCRPLVSEDLKKIKLVDVETRQIVMYPPEGCDYVALSYVWGDVIQPGYKLGTILPTLPATLEDAMVVTHQLGKRYLWADSVCIDQDNKAEKDVQIPLMSAIYTGAWATIFNIAGQSARSGLPRVGTLKSVIAQPCFEIGKRTLLSTMPTLSQQISRSVWATRAWTFQEGQLSPRRLFFTNHQVYFECNSVQCCESLDHTNSPFHLASNDERRALIDTVAREFGQAPSELGGRRLVFGNGVLRDPFLLLSQPEEMEYDETIEQYGYLVSSYTSRKMSNDEDSLNAFSALLTRLTETRYPGGFVQGLPVEKLHRTLLWTHDARPRRRVDFPAWSWAGWEGTVTVFLCSGEKRDLPPLRAWTAGDGGQPCLIYEFDPTPWRGLKERESEDKSDDLEDHVEDLSSSEDTEEWEDTYSDEEGDPDRDPILLLAKEMFGESPAIPPSVDHGELLIEGIGLTFKLRLSLFEDRPEMNQAECSLKLKGIPRRHRFTFHEHNAGDLMRERNGKTQEFLVLSCAATAHPSKYTRCALLLVDCEGMTATRVAVVTLELEDYEFLAGANPQRKFYKLK